MTKFRVLFFIFFLIIQSKAENLITLERDISQIESDIANQVEELRGLNEKLKALEAKVDLKKKDMSQRMYGMSQLKKINWGNPILTQNLSESDRSLYIFKKLNEYEVSLTHDLQLEFSELQYEKNKKEKINLVLKNQLSQLQEKQKQMAVAEKEFIELQIKNDPNHFIFWKGKLYSPLDSDVLTSYGLQKSSNKEDSILVKGLVFNANKSRSVKAIGPGQVIFRDVIRNWGESLILGHKGDYFSVYAGLKNIKVNLNDDIKSGDEVGQTVGPEFYFELRHHDIPINPIPWLRKNKYEKK